MPFRGLFRICLAAFLLAPLGPMHFVWGQPVEDDWTTAQRIFPGIQFVQRTIAEPRPMKLCSVRIDLSTDRLRLATTGRTPDWLENKTETERESTRNFIRRSRQTGRKIVIAINANAFSPWPAPYRRQSKVDLRGLAVSDGILVSPPDGAPSLLVDQAGQARIERTRQNADLRGVTMAVSGMGFCLRDGRPEASGPELHPRTGIGLSRDGRYLYLLTIDGRQPDSHGATIGELGEWLTRFGADDGLNMDGGGSTTLAWWNESLGRKDKCRLLNSPVGDGLNYESQWGTYLFVPTERANGNNLGVYFEE